MESNKGTKTLLSYPKLKHLDVNIDHYDGTHFQNLLLFFVLFFLIRPTGRVAPKKIRS